jgi:hypothetical protein
MAGVTLEQLEARAADAERRLDSLEKRQLQGADYFVLLDRT